LGFATIAQTMIAIWGPFWPTAPEISAAPSEDGSSPLLHFSVVNKSGWFGIADIRLSCAADSLWYLDDAGHKFGLGEAFQPPDVVIDKIDAGGKVDFPCDMSQVMTMQPDGSLNLFGLASKPGLVSGIMRLDTLCLRVFATYKTIGRDSSYPSKTFAWVKTPTGHRWIEGPIAHRPNAEYPCGTTEQPPPSFPSAYIARRQPVEPLSYLVEPTVVAAQARSQQQCAALGCDGVHSIYWWAVVSLTDGTAAVVIEASGPYSASTTVASKTGGLTAAEIVQLKTAVQLGPLLPPAKP
jgi:hypothetical protein